MKLFRVMARKFGYDEFDSCIVAAESINDIKKMFEPDKSGSALIKEGQRAVFFSRSQLPLVIEEINLNNYKNQVILASFNAG